MSVDETQPDIDSDDKSSDAANASRKGQPWTEEEHLAFLAGLRALGRGNWRGISKNFVPSRTPTQVASHAQKHFMRVAGATKRKSRFTSYEVVATGKPVQSTAEPENGAQASLRLPEQQAVSAAQATQLQQQAPAFPAMPFPFMQPMMFGFPPPFFPPFMCPPPAFAAAALCAMQKQGQMPMMMPPMFPMAAAAMAAMNPFFVAQQMAAAAASAAAAAAATAAQQAATSGGATTAGTAATATTDTANSGEVTTPRPQSPPGSPPLCKPAAVHATRGSPAAVAPSPAPAASGDRDQRAGSSGSGGASGSGRTAVSGGRGEEQQPGSGAAAGSGGGAGAVGGGPAPRLAEVQLLRSGDAAAPAAAPGAAAGPVGFHASSHSAFRRPQAAQMEIKTES